MCIAAPDWWGFKAAAHWALATEQALHARCRMPAAAPAPPAAAPPAAALPRHAPCPAHAPCTVRHAQCACTWLPCPRGRSMLRSSMRHTYLHCAHVYTAHALRTCVHSTCNIEKAARIGRAGLDGGCGVKGGRAAGGQGRTRARRPGQQLWWIGNAAQLTQRRAWKSRPAGQQGGWQAHFLARLTAVATSAPFASSAAMADARLHPVPWVLPVLHRTWQQALFRHSPFTLHVCVLCAGALSVERMHLPA